MLLFLRASPLVIPIFNWWKHFSNSSVSYCRDGVQRGDGKDEVDIQACIQPALRAGPTLWSPVHHASSPHLRIGHTSFTLSQDNFLWQPSNVLTKNDELPSWPFTLKRNDGLSGYDCGHYWSWIYPRYKYKYLKVFSKENAIKKIVIKAVPVAKSI